MKRGTAKPRVKTAVRGENAISRPASRNVLSAGLGFLRHIRALTEGYGFTERDLAGILDVNTRTVTRWKAENGRLSPQQIDRIRVLESILDLGTRVLGSANEVKLWLNSPVFSLEGQKPLDLIKTESGRRRVENVLLQIDGGVY